MTVFDCAIKREEEARLYYEKLAADATVPELKNLFTLLAESEQEHHDALLKMKEDVGPVKARFKGLQEAECVFRPLLEKRDRMTDLKEYPDAYQQVLKEEEEGVRFYEDLAAKAQDDGVRKILLMIVDEERKHLSIVDNIYSFVKSPKDFLASGEFSNLKEY